MHKSITKANTVQKSKKKKRKTLICPLKKVGKYFRQASDFPKT